jgi:UDP-N-acetylmuramate: L-alanyl-gamma-D-glutamyl-meso-diaminopimelate ligase
VGQDYYTKNHTYVDGEMHFELRTPQSVEKYKTTMAGEHNLLNVIGAISVLRSYGLPPEKIQAGLNTFQGVRRRQEVFAYIDSVTIVDDFAHHPTAVAKTISAMRQKYPGRRLWAIFEPRSNTSRRNVFKREFVNALALADRVIIGPIYAAENIPPVERLDVQGVADEVMRRGVDAHYIARIEYLLEFVIRGVNRHDVILVMSNGSFNNILPRLEESLKRRRIV